MNNELENCYGYNLISKYRKVLMGLAIIMIMLCHLDVAQSYHGLDTNSIAKVLHIFTVGVDIFLFLSGLGLYYSYRSKKLSYWAFEKKRIIRILPMYLVMGGVAYLIFDIIIKKQTVGSFLSDLFFVSWFRFGSTKYWYILTIIVFYLVFPLIYKAINTANIKRNLLIIIVFSVCLWIAVEALAAICPYLLSFRIALERLPVFIIGTFAGKLSFEKKAAKKQWVIVLALTGFILFLLLRLPNMHSVYEYLYYPVRTFLAISIIIMVIVVGRFLQLKTPSISKVIAVILGFFGGLTLELYLLHQSFMIILDYPPKMINYCIAAFVLPTVTSGIIYFVKKGLRR